MCISSWNRHAPNTMPALAKAGGNYPQLAADPHGSGGQRIRRRHRARRERAALGRIRREPLPGSRRRSLHHTPLAASVLNGITRASLLTLARDLGIPVVEQSLPREMLYIADEAFFTGTAAEVTHLRSVDRIPDRRWFYGADHPGSPRRVLRNRQRHLARSPSLADQGQGAGGRACNHLAQAIRGFGERRRVSQPPLPRRVRASTAPDRSTGS